MKRFLLEIVLMILIIICFLIFLIFSVGEIIKKDTEQEIAFLETLQNSAYISYRDSLLTDDSSSNVTVSYSTKNPTYENITVTITSNEQLQELEEWKLSEDKYTLTKVYTENITEEVIVRDLIGNITKVTIEIKNIDRIGPSGKITYSTSNPTNQPVTVTIESNKIVKNIDGWELSEDKYTLTKVYNENIEEDVTIEDLAGNKTIAKINISNIDKIPPKINITYNTQENTSEPVIVTIYADEKLKRPDGWSISEDRKSIKKQYIQNLQENVTVEDLAGNKVNATVIINNIDATNPIGTIRYSNTQPTSQPVVVTITFNVDLQPIEGWTLSEDKKTLTKAYNQNTQEEVTIKSVTGYEGIVQISINNIITTAPIGVVTYSTTDLTNQNVLATITFDVEMQELEGWTLSDNKKVFTKEYSENTQEELIVKDLANNKAVVNININNIDKQAPNINVIYSETELTNQNVLVTISANEELQQIEGWTLSEDKMSLEKAYEENMTEQIIVKDLAGNEAKVNITITNIDKQIPNVNIRYSITEPTNQNVLVTITADEELQPVDGWTLSEDKMSLEKIYEENTTEEIIVKNVLGKECKIDIVISNIDKQAPDINIKYSTTEPTNQNVLVTITANEKLQQMNGWILSEDKMSLEKLYEENTTEEIIVKDLAQNEAKANIVINNISIPDINRADPNGDGKIDMTDFIMLIRQIAVSKNSQILDKHTEWELKDNQKKSLDINGDDKIDITDITLMLRHISASKNEETNKKHPEWIIK